MMRSSCASSGNRDQDRIETVGESFPSTSQAGASTIHSPEGPCYAVLAVTYCAGMSDIHVIFRDEEQQNYFHRSCANPSVP